MSNFEFDPIIDGLKDAKQLGTWLIAHQAKLDVSECHGLAATRLVVEDQSGTGEWCIPLRDAIDMVDIDDGWFATRTPAQVRIKEPGILYKELDEPVVEVVYVGIDDELRRSTVDADASATFEPIQKIPNN